MVADMGVAGDADSGVVRAHPIFMDRRFGFSGFCWERAERSDDPSLKGTRRRGGARFLAQPLVSPFPSPFPDKPRHQQAE